MPTMTKSVLVAATVSLLHCAAARADTPIGLWEADESHVEIHE